MVLRSKTGYKSARMTFERQRKSSSLSVPRILTGGRYSHRDKDSQVRAVSTVGLLLAHGLISGFQTARN